MSDTPIKYGKKACSSCGETTRVIRANGLCCHCDFERLSKIPTPRTNVVIMQCHSVVNVGRAYLKMVSHAEQLERELAAMTKRADEMERLKEHNAQLFYRIERELADLKAQHAWRPIETAPKDGASVWILCGKDRVCSAQWKVVPFVGTGWFCCVPCCSGWAFGSDTFIHGKDDQPTHWQPLPEPPKGSAE